MKFSNETLKTLKNFCAANRITLHSLLITALIKTQYELQSDSDPDKKYLQKTHMPVNMRDKYLHPIGDELGFYAVSIILKLQYNPKKSFAENCRIVHKSIKKNLNNQNLFQLLRLNLLSPTLIDSTYFQRFGLIENPISKILVKIMGIANPPMVGTALTNLGVDKLPVEYHPYRIEAIYGPSVYSEILEKVVSAVSVNGNLYMTITYEESVISSDLIQEFKHKFIEFVCGVQ